MIKLEKFTEADFDRLINWIDSAEELVQFAGPIFSYPLSVSQLSSYLDHNDKIPLKILDANDKVIGHCEINLGNKYPRLSRILIGNAEDRGKGLGVEIVKEMIERIKVKHASEIVDLNVFAWNKAAIRCYEKAGFEIIHEHTDTLEVHGLSWKRLNMQYKVTRYE